MDSRITIALEKAKIKRTIAEQKENEAVKKSIVPIKPVEIGEEFLYMFDVPPIPKEFTKRERSPIDVISSIMNKPLFDLSKVNEEMQREMKNFHDTVGFEDGSEENDPIKTLNLI
jgi:hypothetical protein